MAGFSRNTMPSARGVTQSPEVTMFLENRATAASTSSISDGGDTLQPRKTAPATRATIRYRSQLLLVRTLASSRSTTLVFAIFSSIERGSSSPRGDTRHWLFFPDAWSKGFQRHLHERVARILRFPPARNRSASNAGARGAIHAPECQTPSSCRPGWRLGACLCAIHSRRASAAIHEFSSARAALPRIPRCDDRGTADALRRNEPCSCGRFSPECRRPDNISDRTTESARERRGFLATRLLHPRDGEKQWEAAGAAAIAFPRPKKFRSSIRGRGWAPADCPPRIASSCIRS